MAEDKGMKGDGAEVMVAKTTAGDRTETNKQKSHFNQRRPQGLLGFFFCLSLQFICCISSRT